jgi:predicted transcriptional regulator
MLTNSEIRALAAQIVAAYLTNNAVDEPLVFNARIAMSADSRKGNA